MSAVPTKLIIQIYAGIRDDLEELMRRFIEKECPRMVDFAEIFREMQFDHIFAGKIAPAELVEFSERLLQMAATYMHPFRIPVATVYNDKQAFDMNHEEQLDHAILDGSMTRPLIERIFGVYVTYALFFLQPSDYVVQVRVTPVQLLEITRLQRDLIEDNHFDTVAALIKLHAHKAFVQVAFNSSYDPVQHKRFIMSEEDSGSSLMAPEHRGSSVEKITNDALLKQLEVLSKANKKVSFLKGVEQIRAIARGDREQHARETQKPPTLAELDRGSIKQRAYAGSVRPNRNRRYADPENQPGALTLARLAESQDSDSNFEEGSSSVQKAAAKDLDSTGVVANSAPESLYTPSKDSKKDIARLTESLWTDESTSSSKSGGKIKGKLKRPMLKDPKFEEEIRKALAPTPLQRSNERLLEKLKRTIKKDDDSS